MERLHLANPDVAEQPALIAPVDLPLPARNHLEPAIQTGKPIVVVLAKRPPTHPDPAPCSTEPRMRLRVAAIADRIAGRATRPAVGRHCLGIRLEV